MRVEHWDCGFGTWFQLRHICSATTFPRNCRASYDMLGLPFFVVRENPAEHRLGAEIQTWNLWGQYKARIWKTGPRYRPWTQGPIQIWAPRCCILAPHQAWNQGPIWVWAPRCRTIPILNKPFSLVSLSIKQRDNITPLSHHLIKSILTSTQYYFNYLILTPILSL